MCLGASMLVFVNVWRSLACAPKKKATCPANMHASAHALLCKVHVGVVELVSTGGRAEPSEAAFKQAPTCF